MAIINSASANTTPDQKEIRITICSCFSFIILSKDTREFIHVRNCSHLRQICFCCVLNPQFLIAGRTLIYLGTIKRSYIKISCYSPSKDEIAFALIQDLIKQTESFYKIWRLIAFTNTTFTEFGLMNLSVVVSNRLCQVISLQRSGIWMLTDADGIVDMTFL